MLLVALERVIDEIVDLGSAVWFGNSPPIDTVSPSSERNRISFSTGISLSNGWIR